MASSRHVVVGPSGPTADRLAADLRTQPGLTAEVAEGSSLTERVEDDPPACIVCTDGDAWTRLELLAAVRGRAEDVPIVVVCDGAAAGPDQAAAATDPNATVLRYDGEPAGEAVARDVVGVLDDAAPVDGTIDGDPETRAADPTDVAALVAERDRFAALVGAFPDPVLVCSLDDEPVVEYVNAAFESTFGWDAGAAVGRPAAEVVTPAEEGELVDFEALCRGDLVERTVERRTEEGVRTFLFRGVGIDVGDGAEGLCIFTDITDRQRYARRVNALHATTRAMLAADDRETVAERAVDAADEVLDMPATAIHFVDDPGEQLVAVAYNEATRELFDGQPPPFTSEHEAVWSVFEDGEPDVVRDVELDDEVDPWIPIRSTMKLPLGDHGVLVSASTDPREFSEEGVDLARLLAANTEAALDRAAKDAALHERERELRAERDQLAALFENIPIAAVKVDYRDGTPTVRDVNPAFEETFGYDRDGLCGENLDDYVLPDAEAAVQPSVTEEAAAGEPVAREVRRRTADGLRDFLLTIAPVETGVEAGLAYGFYIDITDRKQRQQRLRVLSRVLRHDIRNRMNVAEGYAELVDDRADDPAVREPARHIRREADDLLELSRKTRLVERTVAATAEDRPADLLVVVRDAVASVRDRYPGCTVETEFATDGPLWAPDTVGVAVQELLENACEHNDADEPRATISVAAEADYLRVEIADNGPGVPPEERELIEEEREPTQLSHGTGIGLWLVKWVVTAHGGEVAFADEDCRGTTVRLRLPRRERPAVGEPDRPTNERTTDG